MAKIKIKHIRMSYKFMGKGISQTDFARIIGISPSYLCQLETGARTPSLKVLRKISKALNLKLDDLIDDESKEVEIIKNVQFTSF